MNGTLQGVATRKSKRNVAIPEESCVVKAAPIIFLIAFDIGSFWFIRNAISLGFDQLVVVIAIIAVMNTAIFLIPIAYPYRWMAVGLSFMILFTIYPMLFTVYVAFTNYGDGHLLTKEQAIPLIEKTTYLPESGKSYSWTAFKTPAGDYALWLIAPDGKSYIAIPGHEIEPVAAG